MTKIFNYKLWFCLAFITLASFITVEFILGRIVNGGYEIFSLLYNNFLTDALTFYWVKLVVFITIIVSLFTLKIFMWNKTMSWKKFLLLTMLMIFQMLIVLNFEYIYLYTGSSLQQLLFAIYFILLIFSMAMISIDFGMFKKHFKISR